MRLDRGLFWIKRLLDEDAALTPVYILGLGFAAIVMAAVLYVNNAGNVHAGGPRPRLSWTS